MSVIERPLVSDQPVQDGTFVIIRLDPQASVAELDAQATYEASHIKPLKCLALLSSRAIFGFDGAADRNKLTMELFLVGRGLPAHPTSWASVPLSPAPAHPETGRPAMHPTTPLPWPDCHIRTLESCAAVISRIHTHTTAGPRLLDDDLDEVRVLAVGDGWDFAHQPRSESPVRPSSPRHHDQPPANGSGSEEPRESLAAVSDFDFLLPAPAGTRPPEIRVQVELWVDIESVADIADPDSFQADIQRLVEIEKHWTQRFIDDQLNRPATSQWVDSFSGANDPIPEDNLDADPDYDEIRPEDAIEHVLERDDRHDAKVELISADDASQHDSGSVATSSAYSEETSEVSSIDSSFASRVQRSRTAAPRTLLVRRCYPLVYSVISSVLRPFYSVLWSPSRTHRLAH